MAKKTSDKEKESFRSLNQDSSGSSKGEKTNAPFIDNSTRSKKLAQLQTTADKSPRMQQAAQLKATMNAPTEGTAQLQEEKTNDTGLPDQLKSGVENLSGVSLDDVKVHRNSKKPAKLQAEAYAQGSDIHLASGKEKHLPHEAWHVAQQKQGRVKPTTMSGNTPVNDSPKLEKEADNMGAKATKGGNNVSTQLKAMDSTSNAAQLQEKAPDPHEATVEESSYASKDIVSTHVTKACTTFETKVKAAKTEAELKTLVKMTGEELWKHATKTVQASKGEKQEKENWNDADIYRARLRMRLALKNSTNTLLKGAKNALLPQLIHTLEQSSRGMTTADFPADAQKKILISGFDPFQGMETNPSGLVAMYFDGKTIGNANIQAAVFPVRFEDFDNKMVENFFGPKMTQVDAILTVSYTHQSPNIDIDRFSANNRGGNAPDNNGEFATAGPILKDGDNFYESSIPHEKVMELNKDRTSDRQYYYPQQTTTKKKDGTTIANGKEDNKKQLSPKKEEPTLKELNAQGAPQTGPGGSYLSNEIHYRVSKMRMENGATKDMPQGHLHIQEPNQHATFMKDMESLIKQVLTTINKPKK